MNKKWEMCSHLLAIRIFRPADSLDGTQPSNVPQLWCEAVLGEYKLRPVNVLSATSDSGYDVNRSRDKLLPSQWDWCLSHMCNRALVEAFGTTMDPHKSKNKGFLDLLKAVKRIIEHIHKSHTMRKNSIIHNFGRGGPI